MTTIKADSYRGRQLLTTAGREEGYYLSDVYGSYSWAKEKAWERCLNKCVEEDGSCFSICSHNTFGFSVSWVVLNGIRMETPNNSYLIVF